MLLQDLAFCDVVMQIINHLHKFNTKILTVFISQIIKANRALAAK